MNNADSIIIRAVRPEDEAGVVALFPHLPFKEALWRWQYHENPVVGSLEASFVVCDGDRVIGFNGAMATNLLSAGATVKTYWSVDFFIHPDYRGRGIGSTLKGRLETGSPLLLAFGSSATSQSIYRKRGWQRSGRVGEYFYQLHSDSARDLAKQVVQWAKRRPTPPPAGYLTNIVPVAAVVDEAGLLWDRCASGYQYAACRTAEYVRWKYAKHPHASYEAVRVVNLNGDLLALGIIRPGAQVSRLVDYIGPRHAANAKSLIIDALLTHCDASCRLQCITTDDEFKSCLEAYGFRAYREPSSFTVFRTSEVNLDAEDWFVMTGDSDADLLDAAADAT